MVFHADVAEGLLWAHTKHDCLLAFRACAAHELVLLPVALLALLRAVLRTRAGRAGERGRETAGSAAHVCSTTAGWRYLATYNDENSSSV